MWEVDLFDPMGLLEPPRMIGDGPMDMKHLAHLQKIIQPGAYTHRALMVEVYRVYQGSREWHELVARVKKRDKYCCWRCHNEIVKNGIIHHLKYENWGKGDKLEEDDCVLVCQGCHNHLHRSSDIEVPFWAMRTPEGMYPSGIENAMALGYMPVIKYTVAERPVLDIPKGHKRCHKCHDYYPRDFGGKTNSGYWVCSNCQYGQVSPNRGELPMVYPAQHSIGSFNTQGATT